VLENFDVGRHPGRRGSRHYQENSEIGDKRLGSILRVDIAIPTPSGAAFTFSLNVQ